MNNKIEIVNVKLTESGELEVVYRSPSNIMYTTYPPRPKPDTVFKDIYKVKGGRIVLSETIKGKLIPPEIFAEKIEF